MVAFSIPAASGGFTDFSVPSGPVLFCGSRHGHLSDETCSLLLDRFGQEGFSFLTGCASGIDACFRQAFRSLDGERFSSLVACAFRRRAEGLEGTHNICVVPQGLPARAALAARTVWMVKRCSLLVLFPSDPIGRGSSLAFKTAVQGSKPVFVVSQTRPASHHLYSVYPSSLYGVVRGFWVLPVSLYESQEAFCCEPA
jgi:hypothetical protein